MTTSEKSLLAEALANLDKAMRPARGSNADPERRRLAARLSELARCEDGELSAFAKRHMPGSAVDDQALRTAREMILAIGRALGPEGGSAEALCPLEDARAALEQRLSEAKEAKKAPASREVPVVMPPPGMPPAIPLPPVIDGAPTVTLPARVLVPPHSNVPAPQPPRKIELPSLDADPLMGTMNFAYSGPLPPALPFAPSARRSSSSEKDVQSDLSTYASLCAELAVFPRDAEAIFAKYGLASKEKRASVDDGWKGRLRADPALYAEWQRLYHESLARAKG